MKTYMFVRHGRADDYGHLLESEHVRLKSLAGQLGQFGLKDGVTALFSSPIARAKETASLIATQCSLTDRVMLCEALGRDVDYLEDQDCRDALLQTEGDWSEKDVVVFVGHASLDRFIRHIVAEKSLTHPESTSLERGWALIFAEGAWHFIVPKE